LSFSVWVYVAFCLQGDPASEEAISDPVRIHAALEVTCRHYCLCLATNDFSRTIKCLRAIRVIAGDALSAPGYSLRSTAALYRKLGFKKVQLHQ
jgi:hypothetical protein